MQEKKWLLEAFEKGELLLPEEFLLESPEEEIIYDWNGGVLFERK